MTLRPILIAGSTASGKSALALALAARDHGCVINADSQQVYSCWRVLTARPSTRDEEQVPHALYGHVGCDTVYSVGAFVRDVRRVLVDCERSGRRAIVVGGTGLYFSALLDGLAEMPHIPADIRAASEAKLDRGGIAALRADLEAQDPVTLARLDPDNPRRIQRAWEVLTATGRGLTDWQSAPKTPVLTRSECLALVLALDTEALRRRIERRVDAMIDGGALDECRSYAASGLSWTLPSAHVLGAQPLISHLHGEMTLETAKARTTIATSQYAKRQRTWFRSRMADWGWVDAEAPDLMAHVPRA